MNIAHTPLYIPEHEWCDVCGDDNIVLVLGIESDKKKQVVLCSKHAAQMVHEIKELNLGF